MPAKITPNFNADVWLTKQGYDIIKNDVAEHHTLTKDGVVVTIKGTWDKWIQHLAKDYVNSYVFPNMHYATSLDASILFDLNHVTGWHDLLKNTERQWLSDPKNLLRLVLSHAVLAPQAKSQTLHDIIRCDSSPRPVSYVLNKVWKKHTMGFHILDELSIETKYVDPGKLIKKKTRYAKAVIEGGATIHFGEKFTAAQVLDIAGVPAGVESLMGEAWSDEWWHHLGQIVQKNHPSATTYALPPDANLEMS